MRRLAPLALVVLAGCHSAPSAESDGGLAPKVPINVSFREVRLDGRHRLWVYEPKGAKGKYPCVLIAPAGSHLFDGVMMGDNDRDEQVPYARRGYVVVGYDVSGPLRRETRAGIKEAATAFLQADLGLKDARRALEWAQKDPLVDSKRIIAVGHSSAGTLALMLAEDTPDISACLAYAPIVDVPDYLRSTTRQALTKDVPGLMERITQLTPSARLGGLRCPTFLFHATDDQVVPGAPLAAFAKAIAAGQYKEVPSGGHYESMIKDGIPAGLLFLQDHGLTP